MSHQSTPRRRWRRTALATAGVSLLAAVAPMIGANPAAAVNAPLTTTNGIGIRVDQNALLGPALELIEDAMQPYVNTKIYQGALANSVMDDPDWVQGSANLELSLDFVPDNTAGYPDGGLKVRADLQNIMMRFYRYGEWWQPECQFRVNPDNGWIDASAYVDPSKLALGLPPLTMNPITAYWDNSPTITREIGNFACQAYLFDEWWDGLWGSGADVADQLEAELNGEAQDLINDLWTEHVTPVISSLNEFGVTFNDVHTDDFGLIVKANTNATAGITIPGFPGGPWNVATTQDAGVTHNIDTVLAQRREVITTIHPNVAGQYLNALNQAANGQWGVFLPMSGTIENVLLPVAERPNYDDSGWFSVFTTVGTVPSITPGGPGGAPVATFPTINLELWNIDDPNQPVATFTATMSGIRLLTEVRSGTSFWGPSLKADAATLSSLVRTQTNGDALSPSASDLDPFARAQWNIGSAPLFNDFISLPPVSIGGLAVSLCSAVSCPRLSGDQRYTEYFNIA